MQETNPVAQKPNMMFQRKLLRLDPPSPKHRTEQMITTTMMMMMNFRQYPQQM
jgi:hypothetical protein